MLQSQVFFQTLLLSRAGELRVLILFSLHVFLMASLCFPAQLFPAFCAAMQAASLTPTQYFLSQTGTVSSMQERLGPGNLSPFVSGFVEISLLSATHCQCFC